ncbi:MAG: PilZ domain-containing protein [Acidobacteria bacterium]|nr:PilZ domain-containing protein [Acidobacteriota bacterium]
MADPKSESPRKAERRRAERVRLTLPVRVNVTNKGSLVDLSEGGALLLLGRSYDPGKQIPVAIEAQTGTIHLAARVVRCTPTTGPTQPATDETAYHVAVEFLALPPGAADALRQLLGQDDGRTVLWNR